MNLRLIPWAAALVGVVVALAFTGFVRLPLPFPGFAIVVAAAMALLVTLAILLWVPARMLWSESDLLRMAFQARHGISATGAAVALEAITTAHTRAGALRTAASVMRDDMAAQINGVADRLDAAAREIFYLPDRQRQLRNVLVRSELIEDAANAHARLRGKGQAETEDLSRRKLAAATEALDAAFDQSDLLAARGLLQEVEVASDVAERLLTPRSL